MGSLHETNPSLWLSTTPGEPERRPFDPALVGGVDVAVVGAGITGLTTALLVLRTGASVAVVEAGRVCSGVTAYTTAKVTSLHGLIYASLVANRGEEAARAYGEANQAAIERVAGFVGELGIDCDFSRRPAYTYVRDPDSLGRIEDEVEAARRLGLPAELTTETDLPYAVAGAVRFDDQAQFHPRRYCLALADRLVADGGHLFERTRVSGVDEERDGCVVRTAGGDLRAGQVVVATLLPFLDRGGFFAKAHPTRSYALAARLEGPVPRGMYLSAEEPTRSVRSAQGDELVVLGGEGHKVGEDPDTRRRYEALEEWARAEFRVAEVTHRWSAQDFVPTDGTPFVGRQVPGSRVFVATGFKKWGMTNGTASAMILADLLSGRENPWADTFDATRQMSTVSGKLVKENVDAARRFAGDWLSTISPPRAEELRAGEAGIVSLGGDKVAAYRDEGEVLHAVSPVCRHLGCLVSFNTAERTWDCPCHGSRYQLDGRVIQGPSVHDLEPKGVEPPSG